MIYFLNVWSTENIKKGCNKDIHTGKFIVLILPHHIDADIPEHCVYNINWPDREENLQVKHLWYHLRKNQIISKAKDHE